jgi:hypothetical protein
MLQRTLFIFALAVSINLAYSGTSMAQRTYVGPGGCSSCHKVATTSWEMSVHAKAFESLKPGVKKREKLMGKLDPAKDYTKDKTCLKCHSTGYQEIGGFKDIASTPEMAGIGCEACHGPGSEYRVLHDKKKAGFTKQEAKAAGEIYGSEDPAVCNGCHLGKDSTFTEKVDKKYKFDRQKALDDRKSLHKKESTKEAFKVKMF